MGFLSDLFGTSKLNTLQGVTSNAGQTDLTSGVGTLASGLQGYQSGLTATAPALSFLTALTKGDQGDVTQAAQPQIDAITQQFDQIRNMISQQPRGGGKASALAEAPFQKSSAIQRTEGDLRANAANSLGNLGTTLAGLGLSEAGVGQNQESIGANLLGTSAGIAEKIPSPLEDINSIANLAGNIAGIAGAI
jgi:uncharacterized phage infection (PIP) family protein YhgE